MSHPIHIVDVFAERPYAGNQLAVVLDADDLSGDAMLSIARETNYSETTFVASARESDGGYRVRIFTPGGELPFAGHPTLGTAWIIRHHGAKAKPDAVRLNLGIGQVPVTFEQSATGHDVVWLLAPPVELGRTCAAERIATALRISAADIDSKTPCQQVTAGISVIIVPLRNLDAVRRSQLDSEQFAPLARDGFPAAVYLFCAETHHSENQLCARFFVVAHGLREDPATGSATACLGSYLLEHRYVAGSDLSLRIEQGYEIHRPSLLFLRAKQSGNSREIQVGGCVVPTVHGQLL